MAGIKQIKRPNKRVREVEEPQDTWLNELLDDYLAGTMHAPRAGVFYPSALGNPCDRYLWLCYHGHMVDQPLPPTCLLYTSPSPRDQRGSGIAGCA